MKEVLESGKALQRALAEPVRRHEADCCVVRRRHPLPPWDLGAAFILGKSDTGSVVRPASPLCFCSKRIVLGPFHRSLSALTFSAVPVLSALLGPTAVSWGGGGLYFVIKEARTFSGALIYPRPRRKHLALGLYSY